MGETETPNLKAERSKGRVVATATAAASLASPRPASLPVACRSSFQFSSRAFFIFRRMSRPRPFPVEGDVVGASAEHSKPLGAAAAAEPLQAIKDRQRKGERSKTPIRLHR